MLVRGFEVTGGLGAAEGLLLLGPGLMCWASALQAWDPCLDRFSLSIGAPRLCVVGGSCTLFFIGWSGQVVRPAAQWMVMRIRHVLVGHGFGPVG